MNFFNDEIKNFNYRCIKRIAYCGMVDRYSQCYNKEGYIRTTKNAWVGFTGTMKTTRRPLSLQWYLAYSRRTCMTAPAVWCRNNKKLRIVLADTDHNSILPKLIARWKYLNVMILKVLVYMVRMFCRKDWERHKVTRTESGINIFTDGCRNGSGIIFENKKGSKT